MAPTVAGPPAWIQAEEKEKEEEEEIVIAALFYA